MCKVLSGEISPLFCENITRTEPRCRQGTVQDLYDGVTPPSPTDVNVVVCSLHVTDTTVASVPSGRSFMVSLPVRGPVDGGTECLDPSSGSSEWTFVPPEETSQRDEGQTN